MLFVRISLLFLVFSFHHTSYAFDHSHKVWGEILKDYLVKVERQTYFKYAELKQNSADHNKFEGYLGQLSAVKKAQYSAFSREQKLAFLINAYNAFTVKLIVDNYPVARILELGGFFSQPWDKKFFAFLDEPKMHLGYIEHDLLRKDFSEPRIHFAINCASMGCPSLLQKPFLAKTLEAQLEMAARDFLNNPDKNRYNKERKILHLSNIFNWFKEDFKKHAQSVHKFVSKYMSQEQAVQDFIASGKPEIRYEKYDWDLNKYKPNAHTK